MKKTLFLIFILLVLSIKTILAIDYPTFIRLMDAGDRTQLPFGVDNNDSYHYRNATWQINDWIYIRVNITNTTNVTIEWAGNNVTNYSMQNSSLQIYYINITNQERLQNYTFNIYAQNQSNNYMNIYNWTYYAYYGGYGDQKIYRKYVGLNEQPNPFNYKLLYMTNATYTYLWHLNTRVLHSEQGTDGTIEDTGYLKIDKISDYNIRNCTGYVGFYVYPTYTLQETNITSFYLHTWLASDINRTDVMLEVNNKTDLKVLSFQSNDTINISSEYIEKGYDYNISYKEHYLVTRLFDTPNMKIDSNTVNTLVVKFSSLFPDPYNPSILSTPSFPSFVIFNLPSNNTLKSLDSDSDGIDDYSELFVYNSDPNNVDTDNDLILDTYDCESFDPTNITICNISIKNFQIRNSSGTVFFNANNKGNVNVYNILSTNQLTVNSLYNCDSVGTNAYGDLFCTTDDLGGGGTFTNGTDINVTNINVTGNITVNNFCNSTACYIMSDFLRDTTGSGADYTKIQNATTNNCTGNDRAIGLFINGTVICNATTASSSGGNALSPVNTSEFFNTTMLTFNRSKTVAYSIWVDNATYSANTSYATYCFYSYNSSFTANASYATNAYFATNSSYARNASWTLNASFATNSYFSWNSSYASNAYFATNASYARNASWTLNASFATNAYYSWNASYCSNLANGTIVNNDYTWDNANYSAIMNKTCLVNVSNTGSINGTSFTIVTGRATWNSSGINMTGGNITNAGSLQTISGVKINSGINMSGYNVSNVGLLQTVSGVRINSGINMSGYNVSNAGVLQTVGGVRINSGINMSGTRITNAKNYSTENGGSFNGTCLVFSTGFKIGSGC